MKLFIFNLLILILIITVILTNYHFINILIANYSALKRIASLIAGACFSF